MKLFALFNGLFAFTFYAFSANLMPSSSATQTFLRSTIKAFERFKLFQLSRKDK